MKEVMTMINRTLLAKPFADAVLEKAKENLVTYGALTPVLFLRFVSGRWTIKALQFPETHERKILYILRLRLELHRQQGPIQEALILSEGWYEEVARASQIWAILRKKAARREGVVLVGRDADRQRYTHVVQPFHRSTSGSIVFEPLTLARYERAYVAQPGPAGLVDYLFSNTQRGGVSYALSSGVPASTH
jgi:hypothetical protein